MSFRACLPSFLVGILVMIPLHHFRHEFFDMIYFPPCDLHLSSLFRELPSIYTTHYLQNDHTLQPLRNKTITHLPGMCSCWWGSCDFHLTSDCWKGTFHGRPACTMSTVQHAQQEAHRNLRF